MSSVKVKHSQPPPGVPEDRLTEATPGRRLRLKPPLLPFDLSLRGKDNRPQGGSGGGTPSAGVSPRENGRLRTTQSETTDLGRHRSPDDGYL